MIYPSDAGSDPRLFPPVLDVPGVADLLGLSIEETRRLIGEGWIDCARVKGRLLFHRDRSSSGFEASAWTPTIGSGAESAGIVPNLG